MSYLPEVYQRQKNGFTERYLGIFQKMYEDMTEKIDSIPSWMEPETAKEEFLYWLSDLFSVEESRLWGEDKLRYLIVNASRLYRIRGTKAYMRELLWLYTGQIPLIVEYASLEKDQRRLADGRLLGELYASGPWEFAVLVMEGDYCAGDRYRQLKKVVDLARPADMECRIIILRPYIFLDQYSYLGINSILGRYKPMKLDGLSTLPFSAVSGEV